MSLKPSNLSLRIQIKKIKKLRSEYLTDVHEISNGYFFIIQIVKVNGNVCTETVNVVPHCPNASENHQRTIRKCSRVCQQYKREYEYHCMSDSSKTGFFEFCAIPKKLFGNFICSSPEL